MWMRRVGFVALGLGIVGASAVVAMRGEAGLDRRPDAHGGVTVLVPAYFYPGGRHRADWDRLAEAARSVPMEVILNPASGPGTKRDPNYVAVLGPLRRAGARILAYVDSDYGRRPLSAVGDDLRAYRRLYEIDGYFIDQMSNRPKDVDHYRSIRRLVREIAPGLRVVGNPGTSTLPEYLETADTLVTFEGPARQFAGYDPRAAAPWITDHSPGRFAAIVYDARTLDAYHDALSRAVRSGAGRVYITDQKMPNPYLGLPLDWPDRVAAVRALNERPGPSAAP
jgi:Spherulation-specific family 4